MNNRIEMETRLYINPLQSRYFNIHTEAPIPYENDTYRGSIKLCEVIDLAYDYVMIPLQVYITGDPLLYKLVTLVDRVKCDLNYVPIVIINERNIRTYQMTKDGKVFMPQFERMDPENIDFEINKKIEYQLIDITPKAHYIRSCGIKMNHDVSERKQLTEEEQIRLYWDEGKVYYIVHQFGFREHDITLLPNKEGDLEHTLRFKVLNNTYCAVNGKLSIE